MERIGRPGRRRVIGLGAALVARSFVPGSTARAAGEGLDTIRVRLRVEEQEAARLMPASLSGLSLEKSVLTVPSVLAPSNRALIALHRGISGKGILRLGGNTSDTCWWQSAPSAPRPAMPDGAPARPRRVFAISETQVRDLCLFVRQTGWKVVWGLNLGTGTAEQAAREASAVTAILGDRLLAFQIGNEPDLYNRYGHAMRDDGWNLPRYLEDWRRFAGAVLSACPQATFWGPDTAISDDWIDGFARAFDGSLAELAPHVHGLSAHYYAEGPPTSPDSTIETLLRDDPRVARTTDHARKLRAAVRRPFFVTEAGSCYLGGKPGVSDVFASALWAADYVLRLATAGCGGVCFHGGGAEIEDGNEGRTPGARTAAEHERALDGAFYSPIAGTPRSGHRPRPLYFGLLAANALAGAELLSCVLNRRDGALTAYAGRLGDTTRLVLVNRDLRRGALVSLSGQFGGRRVAVRRLMAPSIGAVDGVSLDTAETTLPSGCEVPVPSGSAAIVSIS